MREKLDFLLSTYELGIVRGLEPGEAWDEALKAYAYVYCPAPGNDRFPLQRAAELALQSLGEAVGL